MSVFAASLTKENMLLLSEITGMCLDGIELQPLNTLYMEPAKISEYLDKVDTHPISTGEEQAAIAELYCNLSYAWQDYEESKGLV